MLGADGAAGLARHQADGQDVVAAGRGGEPAGDHRAGLGGEGEQPEQDPGLGLVEHPVMRARREQRPGGGALGCALLRLTPGQRRLDRRVVPGRLRDAGGRGLAPPEQGDRDVDAGRFPPGGAGGDLVGVVVRAADVARGTEVEPGGHQRVRGRLVGTREHPLGQVAELRRAVHAAALRLGDLAEQRDHGGDGGAGRGAQPGGSRFHRCVVGEPGPQRGPAPAPVVVLVVVGQERPVVGARGQTEHRARARAVDHGDRGGQPRQVPVELGHEIGHVGEQRVLVLEERLGRGVGRAHQLGEGQVELRRAAGHVVEDGVQP